MNQIQREPVVNNVQALIPQSTLDADGVTGATLDLTDTKRPKHKVIVIAGTLTEVDRAFVRIEESDEGTVWNRLIQFNTVTTDGIAIYDLVRTKRRIRAVVSVETPDTPTAPAIPISVLLVS